MRIGGFDFSPGLWPSLFTVVVLPVMIGLGNWQLERAVWKQGLVDVRAETIKLPPQPLLDVIGSGGSVDYRPVTVAGHYDLERQLLLDNVIYKGTAGYYVLTPLVLEGREDVVLVNRGWLPTGRLRSVLPALPGPDGKVFIRGTLARSPDKAFRLGPEEEPGSGWPQVIQQVEFDAVEQRLGGPLLPVVIQLDPALPHGFTRDWEPVFTVTPDKHRAYAMQWYTLALVLMLIYIGVNTKRISNQGNRKE